MNIRGVTGTRNVMEAYNTNTVKVRENKEVQKNDYIEISKEAKAIMNFTTEGFLIPDDKRVEEVKNQINNSTYKVDSRLIANSLYDAAKRGRF